MSGFRIYFCEKWGALTPLGCSAPPSCWLSLPGGLGEKTIKLQERMDSDKYSLLGKAKTACASRANQGIHLMILTGRQLSATPRKAGLIMCYGFMGRQMQTQIYLFLILYPSFHCSAWQYTVSDLSLVWVYCPDSVPPPSSKIQNLASCEILQRKFTLFHPKLSHLAMRY